MKRHPPNQSETWEGIFLNYARKISLLERRNSKNIIFLNNSLASCPFIGYKVFIFISWISNNLPSFLHPVLETLNIHNKWIGLFCIDGAIQTSVVQSLVHLQTFCSLICLWKWTVSLSLSNCADTWKSYNVKWRDAYALSSLYSYPK